MKGELEIAGKDFADCGFACGGLVEEEMFHKDEL